MSSSRQESPKLERPNQPSVLILTSLASGPKHGYALTVDIEQFAKVKLGPGTMYGAISRLESGGFIEALPSSDRRKPYRITESGRQALVEAAGEMRSLADTGISRLAGSSRLSDSLRARGKIAPVTGVA